MSDDLYYKLQNAAQQGDCNAALACIRQILRAHGHRYDQSDVRYAIELAKGAGHYHLSTRLLSELTAFWEGA